jgi:hypothetical protein
MERNVHEFRRYCPSLLHLTSRRMPLPGNRAVMLHFFIMPFWLNKALAK